LTKSRSPDIDMAQVTGAALKNPSRFREQRGGIHSPALGGPSAFLDAAGKACWHKFKSELPHLVEADRCIVEMACVLRSKVEAGNAHAALMSTYRGVLKELAATPASRARVKTAPPEDIGKGKNYFS